MKPLKSLLSGQCSLYLNYINIDIAIFMYEYINTHLLCVEKGVKIVQEITFSSIAMTTYYTLESPDQSTIMIN